METTRVPWKTTTAGHSARLFSEWTETATARSAGTAERDFTAVDQFLKTALPRMDGGCALILVEGDQVIYRKAFNDFTTETVVPIASASKWISGGVIMALVDDGTIRLDDRASKFLPQFTEPFLGTRFRSECKCFAAHSTGLTAMATASFRSKS